MSTVLSEEASSATNPPQPLSNMDNNNTNDEKAKNKYQQHECKLKHMINANINNNNNNNNVDFEQLTCECKNQMDAKMAAKLLSQCSGTEESHLSSGSTGEIGNLASAHAKRQNDNMFTLKRWNLVAMWSWDVECEVCAICRTPLMGNF